MNTNSKIAAAFLISLVLVPVHGEEPIQTSDLISLKLVPRDLFEADKAMTICDLDEDGFIDAAEKRKLTWEKDFNDFDIDDDNRLSHLEAAIHHAYLREEYDITQFDIKNAQNLIRRGDQNKNGQMDPSEIVKGWPRDPKNYDLNSDGIITLFEWAANLAAKRVVRRELGIEAVDNMSSVKTINTFDRDNDGKLNAEEWAAAPLPRDASLHDDNGDGLLEQDELAILFSKHRRDTGLSKSDATKAKKVIAYADRDGDGQLTGDEVNGVVFADESESKYGLYDLNKDKKITLAEVQAFIASERKKLGFDDADLANAKRLILRYDANRSTFLEPNEFPKNQASLSKASLEKADVDKDEKISAIELAKLLARQ